MGNINCTEVNANTSSVGEDINVDRMSRPRISMNRNSILNINPE